MAAHAENMKSRVPKTHHCWRRRCLWASNPWPWGCRCGSSRSEAPPAGGRRRHPGPSAYYPSRPAGSRASAGQAHLGPCWRSYSTWQRGQGGGKGSAPTGSGWTVQVVAFLVRQGTCLRWWLIYCAAFWVLFSTRLLCRTPLEVFCVLQSECSV